MNLRQQIYGALSGSQELTAIVNNEIYFFLFPENYDHSKDAVLYSISTSDALKDLRGNVLQKTHLVNFTITSKSVEKIYDMMKAIEKAVMGNFQTGEQSIDEVSFDNEFQVYVLEMNFEIN